MTVAINWWAVIVCGVFSMVLGMIWYGKALFGRTWMKVIGMDPNLMTPEKQKEMQKKMLPMYILQFILSILTAYILAHYAAYASAASGASGISAGLTNAFWIWLGFVMPIQAGNAMWGGKDKKTAWMMFYTTAGYQLVFFLGAGIILALWK